MKKIEKIIIIGIVIFFLLNMVCIKDTKAVENSNNSTQQNIAGSEQNRVSLTKQTTLNGYFYISTALNEKKVLDVKGASTSNTANIQLWDNVNEKQQIFKVTPNGNGYYTIKNALSNKVLDVANGTAKSGTNVWQYEANGTDAQSWIIKEAEEEGYYYIVSKLGGLYLDVEENTPINGTNVRISNENGKTSQKFKFTETEVIIGERTIDDGYYTISTKSNNNKILDVSTASASNRANIQLWDNVNEKQQKFKVTYNGNGYYTIKNVLSKKVLDVENGIAKSGTNVWQYEANGTNAQSWIIKEAEEKGYYYIISKLGNLYLDAENTIIKNGTNIRISNKTGTDKQKFKFTETTAVIPEKTIESGYYTISTKLDDGKILDISSASKENKANVQIWSNANVKQQKFKVTYDGNGYYTIQNVLSKKMLDVANGAAVCGANVWQYENNNTNAQKWIIAKDNDGYCYIASALCDTLYLDISNASNRDGANVWLYDANNSTAQKFKFNHTDVIVGSRTVSDGYYKIAMLQKRDTVLDISGGSTANKANVQTWTYTDVLQQKFKVTYIGDGYYSIVSAKSKKALDVANGNGSNGANVWQYDYNGSDAQKWIIRHEGYGIYNIISACNDKFLTEESANAGCGTNVEINEGYKPDTQRFVFDPVTVVELEEGTYGYSGLKLKGDSNGSTLKWYRIGNGPNVFFGTFAVHGFEDKWSYDGQELTRIAENFKDRLLSMQDGNLAKKWSIYLLPSVNPDGEYHGYTNNGPGRTSLWSDAPGHKGIDINRCWSVGYKRETGNRNYNGTEPFQSCEARALRDFMLGRRATNGQTVVVDLHGWLNETIGDEWIGSKYRSYLGLGKHIYSYGQGYLVNWARSNLGYGGRAARSCLVELPAVSNSSQVSSWGLSDGYINATLSILREMY